MSDLVTAGGAAVTGTVADGDRPADEPPSFAAGRWTDAEQLSFHTPSPPLRRGRPSDSFPALRGLLPLASGGFRTCEFPPDACPNSPLLPVIPVEGEAKLTAFLDTRPDIPDFFPRQ